MRWWPRRGNIAVLVLGCVLANSACTNSSESVPSASPNVEASSGGPAGGSEIFTTTLSDFGVTYRLEGSLQDSVGVEVDVPPGLTFTAREKEGASVREGQPLGSLELPSITQFDAGTVDQSRLTFLRSQTGTISAPVQGTLTTGNGIPAVSSRGIDAVVPLTPLQIIRYRGFKFSGTANIETVLGQRAVACSAVWLSSRGTSLAGSAPSDGGAAPAQSASALHCRLPRGVETAAGLPATLELRSRSTPNSIAVPTIYIGLDPSGEDYFVITNSGGARKNIKVTVGATDGVRRLITSGVKAGMRLEAVSQQ